MTKAKWDMFRSAALPVGIVIALGGRQLRALFDGGLINPDSYMRLVRLRETLLEGRPAYAVANDGSGSSTILHWSHLLDSLLCLIATPFMLVFHEAAALHAAALIQGPLSIALLGLAICWAVRPFAPSSQLVWLGPVIAALSPAVGAYAVPGVVHHHVPVLVAVVMAGGHAARLTLGTTDRGSAVSLGAWAATAIWLTPESLPIVLMIFGALWVQWAASAHPSKIAPLMSCVGLVFLVVLSLAYVVDPPLSGYGAVEIDRISIVFVGLAGALLGSAVAAWAADYIYLYQRPHAASRIVVASVAALCCGAAWVAAFPDILNGFGAMLADSEWHAMFDHISEMQSVTSVAAGAEFLGGGVIATVFLGYWWWRAQDLRLGFLLLCSFALLAEGAEHVRFAAWSEVFAAVLAPLAVLQVQNWTRSESAALVVRLSTTLIFLLCPSIGNILHLSTRAEAAELNKGPNCEVSKLGSILKSHIGEVILANVNDSPELLYRYQVRTVGSLYHRNVDAFMRLRAAWRSEALDSVPSEILRTRATLVLFCQTSHRSALVSDLPTDTFFDRLNRGDIPAWLQRIAEDQSSGNVLYRVQQ
jgi:hypothetical protein